MSVHGRASQPTSSSGLITRKSRVETRVHDIVLRVGKESGFGTVENNRCERTLLCEVGEAMRMQRQSPLKKRARRGFRGYPIATMMFYGPTDQQATKVAVGIVAYEGADAEPLMRWWSAEEDVRHSRTIGDAILAFIQEHAAKSVVMADRITGCPHEEGKDYPEGQVCPACPFWINRNRWTGEPLS